MRSRQPRGRAAGLPAFRKPPAPVSRPPFLLFYQVEIRHRQLLKSAISHPLKGADAQEK
jgi:hypothetical protein